MGIAKLLLGGAIVLGGIAGCSVDTIKVDQVKGDAIYATYGVSYDADNNMNFAGARFRVGGATGTNIDLGGGSSVTHNGNAMRDGTLSKLTGKYYEQPLDKYERKHDFVFTNDGKKYRNSISIEKIGFADKVPEKISQKEPLTLKFEGPPLANGETITLTVDQGMLTQQGNDPFKGGDGGKPNAGPGQEVAKHFPFAFNSTKVAGATGVTITADQLSALKEGSAKIYWTRTMETKLQEAGPLGGTIVGSYKSQSKPVTITK